MKFFKTFENFIYENHGHKNPFSIVNNIIHINKNDLSNLFEHYGIVAEDVNTSKVNNSQDPEAHEIIVFFSSKRYDGNALAETLLKIKRELESFPEVDNVYINTNLYKIYISLVDGEIDFK